jgi:hypothetical protein
MSDYVYQIQGTLESEGGIFKGLRVLVCDLQNFESVDVPAEVLSNETVKYIQFRLKASDAIINIAKLPNEIQNRIRAPLGRWLDEWVRQNFYGYISDRKSINS